MMRMMWLAGGASLLGGGAYLGGAFDQGEYYPMAPASVEARLAAINFGPELIIHNNIEEKIALDLRSRSLRQLRWDLTVGGRKVGAVHADLAPEQAGTRVSVSVDFIENDVIVGGGDDPFTQDFAQIMMTEKVDSILDGRAFDQTAAAARLAGAIAADPQAIAKSQEKLHQQVERDMQHMGGLPSDERRRMAGMPPRDRNADPDRNETDVGGGWGSKSR